MDFLELIDTLIELQKKFPDMKWETQSNSYLPSRVDITLYISQENADLLLQAQQMFAPR